MFQSYRRKMLDELLIKYFNTELWTLENSYHCFVTLFIIISVNYITLGRFIYNSATMLLIIYGMPQAVFDGLLKSEKEECCMTLETTRRKLKDCVHLLLHHSLTTVVMLPVMICHFYDWYLVEYGSANFDDWSNRTVVSYAGLNITTEFLCYLCYIYQLAYYVHALVIDIFVKEDRKTDFYVMVVHHIVAFILITIACTFPGLRKPGLIIMFLHDSTDVLLYFTKISSFLQRNSISKVCFGLFSACFIGLRVGYLPISLILYELRWGTDSMNSEGILPLIAHGLLWTLIIFQMYWTKTIIKILRNVVNGQPVIDVRENTGERTENNSVACKTQ